MLVLGACSTIEQCIGPQPGCTESGLATTDNATESEGDVEDMTEDEVVDADVTEDIQEVTYEDLVNDALNDQDDSAEDVEEVIVPVEEDSAPVEEEFIGFTTLEYVEGDLISLDISAVDPDGDEVTFSYEEPIGSEGSWQTRDGDAGTYVITVTASDGVLSTSEDIRIIVSPSNKGPVITCPSQVRVDEGDLIDLDCEIIDQEGDEVTYEITGFMDDFTYQTDFEDAGRYTVVITATDGNKETTQDISIIVADVNRAPTFEAVDAIVVTEGEVAQIEIEAADEDGDSLIVRYPQPFDETGEWETAEPGIYKYDVELSDGETTVLVPITVEVQERNDPPVITAINTITVKEGELITLPIEVEDESEDVQVTISGFMTSETYQTTYDDAGMHEVTIVANDGVHQTSSTVDIVVENVNRPPVFVVN
jgi:hypothetical protein